MMREGRWEIFRQTDYLAGASERGYKHLPEPVLGQIFSARDDPFHSATSSLLPRRERAGSEGQPSPYPHRYLMSTTILDNAVLSTLQHIRIFMASDFRRLLWFAKFLTKNFKLFITIKLSRFRPDDLFWPRILRTRLGRCSYLSPSRRCYLYLRLCNN